MWPIFDGLHSLCRSILTEQAFLKCNQNCCCVFGGLESRESDIFGIYVFCHTYWASQLISQTVCKWHKKPLGTRNAEGVSSVLLQMCCHVWLLLESCHPCNARSGTRWTSTAVIFSVLHMGACTISQTVSAWMKLGYYCVYVWPTRNTQCTCLEFLISTHATASYGLISMDARSCLIGFPCQLVSFCVTADVYADSINFFWFAA